MKLDAVSAYSVAQQATKPAEGQTAQTPAPVTQIFEDDVVNLSGVNAGNDQLEHNGFGKHLPETEFQIEHNGHGKHPPE